MKSIFGLFIFCFLFALIQAHTLFLRRPETQEISKVLDQKVDVTKVLKDDKNKDHRAWRWFPKVQNQFEE